MEHIAPFVSIFVSLGLAVGSVTNAIDKYKYDNALQEPGFLHLVDQYGEPVGKKAE